VAVMETQLSGLPVLATRRGGISEVVLEEQTGLLVEGMAAAIARLVRGPDLAHCGWVRQVGIGLSIGHYVKLVSNFLAGIAPR